MHCVLYIDEIIRRVFELAADDGHRGLSTLARCCRAWKDPALDNLWSSLVGAEPLLALIPGVKYVGGIYTLENSVTFEDLQPFRAYASRVTHIAHKTPLNLSGPLLDLFASDPYLLPRLTSAQISSAVCTAPLPLPFSLLVLSPRLRSLSLDLGFKRSDRRPSLALLLSYGQSSLEQLSIRGLMTLQISASIPSLHNLRLLSLRTGKSLTAEALAALTTFPRLAELELHAVHLDADSFPLSPAGAVTFPALRKLHLRANAPLAERVLQCLQPDTLHTLRIDLEAMEESSPPYPVLSLFAVIASKAPGSLRALMLEHHPDSEITTSKASVALELGALRPLAEMRGLQRLVLDTSPPPAFSDADMSTLSKWLGRRLTYLDLGGMQECTAQATVGCLPVLARACPMLENLSLPLDIRLLPTADAEAEACALRRLTVSCTAPPVDVDRSAQFLRMVFPMLEVVDGPCEHEELWATMTGALRV